MFKKLALGLTSLTLLLMTTAPVAMVKAASSNLIANPSVETATGGQPAGWTSGNWGTNTTAFTYKTTDGHTGTSSLLINMTSYTSGDAKWYFSNIAVQPNTQYTYGDFYKSSVTTEVDAQFTDASGNLSYAYLSAPAASAGVWSQMSATFITPSNVKSLTIFHVINKVGSLQTDDFSLMQGTGTPTATPPTVSMSAPAANATLGGTQTVTAAAADSLGTVTGVQFLLDGIALSSPVTAAPYSTNWDTTKTANGGHTLSAVATNNAGQTGTATAIAVTVQNVIAPGTNLISNPSLESATGSQPTGWSSSSWGTNTAAFTYLTTGHTGSRSVKTQISSYTNGSANWYYAGIPVTPGKTYQYSDWYQSNVDTEVDAEALMSDGSTQYFWLGNVFANAAWTKYTTTFTPPAGAKSIIVYQVLAKKGFVITDDYSLIDYTPAPFNRPIVSVTLDDGWTNQYLNAFPVLQKYGLIGTFFIISGEMTDQPDYMSAAQVKSLFAYGNEIGSHTVTHPDLTTVSQTKLVNEMANSQKTLQNLLGVPVTDFAYPYGAYNANTISVGKKYYQSQRTVNAGMNTKDSFDLTQLKIEEVDSNISQAQVQGWINAAVTQKTWLILVYHEIAVTPSDPTDSLYDTQPSDFSAEMAYLKSSGAAVETVHQAINEVLPQL